MREARVYGSQRGSGVIEYGVGERVEKGTGEEVYFIRPNGRL